MLKKFAFTKRNSLISDTFHSKVDEIGRFDNGQEYCWIKKSSMKIKNSDGKVPLTTGMRKVISMSDEDRSKLPEKNYVEES